MPAAPPRRFSVAVDPELGRRRIPHYWEDILLNSNLGYTPQQAAQIVERHLLQPSPDLQRFVESLLVAKKDAVDEVQVKHLKAASAAPLRELNNQHARIIYDEEQDAVSHAIKKLYMAGGCLPPERITFNPCVLREPLSVWNGFEERTYLLLQAPDPPEHIANLTGGTISGFWGSPAVNRIEPDIEQITGAGRAIPGSQRRTVYPGERWPIYDRFMAGKPLSGNQKDLLREWLGQQQARRAKSTPLDISVWLPPPSIRQRMEWAVHLFHFDLTGQILLQKMFPENWALPTTAHLAELRALGVWALACGWKEAIVVQPPKHVRMQVPVMMTRDETLRAPRLGGERERVQSLHCETGPAIEWADGTEQYFWRGIEVPKVVVMNPERLKPGDILTERNLEVRRVMTERFGEGRLMVQLGGRQAHRDARGVLWTMSAMDPTIRTLFDLAETATGRWEVRSRTRDTVVAFVEVVNSTPEPDGTFKTYFIRVPPTMKTASEAVAWTFRKDPKTYQPKKET